MRELATRVGTSNQQISHLELGKRQLTTDWLFRLAVAILVSISLSPLFRACRQRACPGADDNLWRGRRAGPRHREKRLSVCDLQRITEVFENGIDQALQLMADYASLGDAGDVSLFKDFGASLMTDASGQLVLSAEAAGVISTETALTELQRRGTLSGDIDPTEEAAKVKAQPPKVSAPAATPGAATKPAAASLATIEA